MSASWVSLSSHTSEASTPWVLGEKEGEGEGEKEKEKEKGSCSVEYVLEAVKTREPRLV
jgi:hypothetical protein